MPGTEFVSSEGHPSIASFFGADDVVKVIYASSDFAMLRELGERQRPELAAHGIGVTYSSGRYVEFVGAGVNKGAGLARLAQLLDVPLADTIAVGDSSNDFEMIETDAIAVGVSNVTDDARPHCDVVLKTRSEDGAFEELHERFVEPDLIREGLRATRSHAPRVPLTGKAGSDASSEPASSAHQPISPAR